jgi:hypothetical protein
MDLTYRERVELLRLVIHAISDLQETLTVVHHPSLNGRLQTLIELKGKLHELAET